MKISKTDDQERLIVFTRYPEPGTTKTRLMPVLGAKGAADLQREMTEHTLSEVTELLESRELIVEIRYNGGDERRMRNWLGPKYIYHPQCSGDIGRRMQRAFEETFEDGVKRAVLIGTDIPDINQALLERAFTDLKQNDAVLGPARDGGYYLIGLQRSALSRTGRDLFADMTWGADNVFEKTLKVAKRLEIRFSLLDVLEDVDCPKNLWVWKRANRMKALDGSNDAISVVIPAVNEANSIRKTLTGIGTANIREIIVVDGGSTDDTVSLARSLGAKVLTGSLSRARQMNRGGAAASGSILLFLHADTRLPVQFDEQIIKALGKPHVAGGAFELRIDSPLPALRRIERLANWRSRQFQMPYGDQGIFMTRERFRQMGGFPDIPIMEDFEMIRRLKKAGDVITLDVPVYTSARRWERVGVLKTTLINQLIIAAYHAGVSPHTIAGWYRRR
ncbi:MAG: TIGR04283 family arsenosugar biosynthesis glycosyltransferase [Deltaproteobacteria bacterium]|nr:TIGR04283 family arsenosugar biosynthesis glycosyltransferase [Deltaproteobacteria bacterium]